ncbi:hypothetical protein [Bradyrhizobium sp.]|uniref:hypothetical protein n=1 Tax=Bradyrhizobium sp. TaxID=376 RepID=UPI004037A71F
MYDAVADEYSAASSLEAAECGFDLGVAREMAAPGLSKSLQHSRKMRGIDFLRIARIAQHGERDVVLAIRRQAANRFQRLFEQPDHMKNIEAGSTK